MVVKSGLPRILCIPLLMAWCHIQSMMIIPAITVMKVMMVPVMVMMMVTVMVQKKSPLIGVSPSIQTSAMNLKPISTIIIITFHTNIIRSRSPSNIIFCQDTSNESGVNKQYFKVEKKFQPEENTSSVVYKLKASSCFVHPVCCLPAIASVHPKPCRQKQGCWRLLVALQCAR